MSHSSRRNKKKLCFFTVKTLRNSFNDALEPPCCFNDFYQHIRQKETKKKIENVDHDLCRNQLYKSCTYACR